MKTRSLQYVIAVILFLAAAIFPIAAQAAPQAEPSVTGPTVVMVSGFDIIGNKAIQESEIITVINDYIKKNNLQDKPFYTLTDLKTIAAVVTAHYQKRGFLLARTIVPEQDIKDGIVKLEVIEGSVGKVVIGGADSTDLSKLKYFKKSYVKGWFKNIFGHGLNEADFEKTLMLLNDTPGLTAKAVLTKSDEAGKSDVQVTVEDVPYPVSLTLEYNNEGAKSVSRDRFGAYLSVTDPYFGSTLSVTGFMGERLHNTRFFGIDYSVPITGTGVRLGFRHIDADYIVTGGKYIDLGIEGDSDVTGGYISHQCIRSRAMNLKLTAGYDRKHMFEYMFNNIMTSNDDLAVAYLRVDFDNIDRFIGKNIAAFTYSHGIPDFHGSLKNNDPLASRRFAGGGFDKYNVELARVQKLWKLILIARGTAQYSPDRLVNPEQFAIGGSATVRGFPTSSFIGDSGYAVTAELRAPLPFMHNRTLFGQKVEDMLQFAVFFDHGSVKRNTTPLVPFETETDDISGAGYGIRINLFDRVGFEADIAYPYINRGFDEKEEEITVKATLNVLKF